MNRTTLVIATSLIVAAALAVAQTSHTGHDHNDQNANAAQDVLTEPGQGAFAALSEIVRVLEADPDTDWTRVDLTGLRAHLVDMDRLVTDAIVTETQVPGGLLVEATGDPQAVAALRRMVPAHAAQLARDDRWTVAAVETEAGVALRVTSDDPLVTARIRGLGFFGLMASQDHHRAHHLAMARGQSVHAH
ncbi:MAG: hypothetical protein AAFO86_12870 [Pseudomonadota bacterium]